MSDPDDPEAQLRRSILLRRTITGVGAVAFGLASLVLGLTMIVLPFLQSGPGRGMIRMGFVGLALGAVFVGAGVRTLRVGEIDPTSGLLVRDQLPVPWSVIGGASIVLACIIGAMVAWPLGLYAWMGTLDSGCRSIVSESELSDVLGQSVTLGSVSDASADLHCTAVFVDGSDQPIATIEMGGDLGGSQFENHLAFTTRGGEIVEVDAIGDRAIRYARGSGFGVAVMRGHAAVFIEARGEVDDVRTTRLLGLLATRLPALEPYAARWIERYGDR
ncbi:MAG: hypothetical protein J0L92_15785 [Deltaproteobacteria bacterium]|nr:hypothetical protein [Deltaproteobacteria bacterium]